MKFSEIWKRGNDCHLLVYFWSYSFFSRVAYIFRPVQERDFLLNQNPDQKKFWWSKSRKSTVTNLALYMYLKYYGIFSFLKLIWNIKIQCFGSRSRMAKITLKKKKKNDRISCLKCWMFSRLLLYLESSPHRGLSILMVYDAILTSKTFFLM